MDGRSLEFTDLYAVKRHDPITVKGVSVHTLRTGIVPPLDSYRDGFSDFGFNSELSVS